jgi:hypothetical protein
MYCNGQQWHVERGRAAVAVMAFVGDGLSVSQDYADLAELIDAADRSSE